MRQWTLLIFLILGAGVSATRADDLQSLRLLPVLQDGRIKPFDTAARVAVRAVTNASSIDDRDPVETALDWAARPWAWEDRAIVYAGPPSLRIALGWPVNQMRVSPAAIRGNQALLRLLGEAGAKPQAAVDLQNRLNDFDSACAGFAYPMVPGAAATDAWQAPTQAGELFSRPWRAGLHAWDAGDRVAAASAFSALNMRIAAACGIGTTHALFSPQVLQREVFYNCFSPFRITTIGYGTALIVLLLALRWAWLQPIGLLLLAGAVGVNLFGFALRCSITGWAPVTNLYETVVWVSAVAATIALVMASWSWWTAAHSRTDAIAACGAAAGLLAAIVAVAMPPDYGSAMRPLPLALRTNFWLSLHVLAIVSSYGAFTLAMLAGNVVLLQWLRSPDQLPSSYARNARLVDRSIQIGTTLAIAGTLLGGLWAEMAWGRFWGWDPKEVWALIIVLAYLTLLHTRLTGRVGAIGMAAGAAGCFAAVLMSWYGVNFILAAGLHSYGFAPGAAGSSIIFGYLLVQFIFLAVVGFRYVNFREAAIESPVIVSVAT